MSASDDARFTKLVEDGRLSEIPRRWLEVFLKREVARLKTMHGLGESEVGIRKRIDKVKEELAQRDQRNT